MSDCGNCYYNLNSHTCPWDRMAQAGGNCSDWRRAKTHRRGRPIGGRGGS